MSAWDGWAAASVGVTAGLLGVWFTMRHSRAISRREQSASVAAEMSSTLVELVQAADEGAKPEALDKINQKISFAFFKLRATIGDDTYANRDRLPKTPTFIKKSRNTHAGNKFVRTMRRFWWLKLRFMGRRSEKRSFLLLLSRVQLAFMDSCTFVSTRGLPRGIDNDTRTELRRNIGPAASAIFEWVLNPRYRPDAENDLRVASEHLEDDAKQRAKKVDGLRQENEKTKKVLRELLEEYLNAARRKPG